MSFNIYGDMLGSPAVTDNPFGLFVDNSYDQPRYAETAVGDIVTQRQDVSTGGADQWTGFFQKAVGSVLEYGIKRDAALTGVQLQAAQRAGTPAYYPTAAVSRGGITVSPMLLIVGGLVAVLVLKK